MTKPLTLVQAFRQGLEDEMRADSRVFVIGTDLVKRGGNFAQVEGLAQEFGTERIRDCPISESAIVAAGVGAALNGLRPVVDLNFIDFGLSAMDEIVNQAAKIRYMWGRGVPLVIRGTAGVALFAAQHNNSLEAVFAHTPGLVVVMPSTPTDAYHMIRASIRADDPVVFLMHKRLTGRRGEIDPTASSPIGRARIVREGANVTLVAYGATVAKCERAADQLAGEGVEADVIDLRTLFPLDFGTIYASVRKTGRALVVTEEPRHVGIGSEVSASVQASVFDYLDAPVVQVAAAHAPIPHSPPLIEAMIPTEGTVVEAVRQSLERWPSTVL